MEEGRDALPPRTPQDSQAPTSYRDIVTSSALIGGASAISIVIGILKTKASALLLGPVGYGYMGLYGSIIDLAACLAGGGLSNSGVRQVAEASGSKDAARVARTSVVVHRVCMVLGLGGAALLAALSGPIAVVTFGDESHAPMVALTSLAVLFQLVQFGRMAVLQGTRRIAELARVQIFGALVGSVAAVGVLAVAREDGAAPALVVFTLGSSFVAWICTRELFNEAPKLRVAESVREAIPLLQLGFAFMCSAFLVLFGSYAIRSIVAHQAGMAAAGLYHTAWTISSLYAGFIFQAMGTDFYPRLIAEKDDNARCNQIVNEQILVGVLLAGPGLLATISCAPVVIQLFYSNRFVEAEGVLRWICLGMALRAVLWPLGYLLIAKDRRTLFLTADAAWTVIVVSLCAALVSRFGAEGAGIAFFAAYLVHGLGVWCMAVRLTGFRLCKENKRVLLLLSSSTAFVCASVAWLPSHFSMPLGGAIAMALLAYSIRTLAALDALPFSISRILGTTAVFGISRHGPKHRDLR